MGGTEYIVLERFLRYFLKKILHLPQTTPSYIIRLESGIKPMYIYTLKCHLSYILKIMSKYKNDRLPKILGAKCNEYNIDWVENLSNLARDNGIILGDWNGSWGEWAELFRKIEKSSWESIQNRDLITAACTSANGIYHLLDHVEGRKYFVLPDSKQVSWIFKARSGWIGLNTSPWREGSFRICSLCNMMESETVVHFIGICPILDGIRNSYFHKTRLSELEIIGLLNRGPYDNLYRFLIAAYAYRKSLTNEFNY